MLKREDLHPYQEAGVQHVLKKKHSALFMEMGLGKTVTTLTTVNTLIYEELEIDKVLVIAPKRVAENVWKQEVKNWAHLSMLKVSLVLGTAKQRKLALTQRADIYVIGRDNVVWLCGLYGGGMLPFDMLVIDELSSFKNPQSKRFKALRRVQPSFKRVVGLTGTPAPNGLMDLWSQIYLLDRGERLGKFITSYREKFFTPEKRNGHIVYKYGLRQGAEEAIHRKIGDICLSMKAKDYLDLPDKIENEIIIRLPDEVQKKYDEFEKEKVLELLNSEEGDTQISAINAGVLAGKLLQFANGAIYDEVKNWHEVHKLKIEAVKEIIEDTNAPVLIAWTYKHDKYRLTEALKKYNPVNLNTPQDIKDWNNGEIRVLMMHPASGGHGLNLQAGGNNIIWFGQTWSLELYQQLNARLHRQGQIKPVIVNKLICSKTMDQDVLRAINRKMSGQEALMAAVKARIKKYF